MPRIDGDTLYSLLPAHHRLRDADEGGPLRDLIAVLAREGAVIEENIEQLIDDLFIETCSDWAVPYVAGVIGYRALHDVGGLTAGPRAEAANTIPSRRRKGTAAVLEQLARDVTGWPARVVEYFQLVGTCQHMNHIRPDHHLTPDLRNPRVSEAIGGAFDAVTRTADVRSIAGGPTRKGVGGRYNFPNIGIHLWRLGAYRFSNTPAAQVDDVRFLFDPLGAPRQLVNRPEAEDTIVSLAQPINVPGDITRRDLDAEPATWYGSGADDVLRSFEINVGGDAVPIDAIEACDLSDDGGGWNHSPHEESDDGPMVRVDPVLGRIAFVEAPEGEVRTTHHLGFPAPIGGGEYNRAAGLSIPTAGRPLVEFPNPEHATVQEALDSLPEGGGIVQISTSDVFVAPTAITAAAGAAIELRADSGARPILRAAAPIEVAGGSDARLTFDGLVIEGAAVNLITDPSGASLGEVRIAHCTLVPGLAFDPLGAPQSPGSPSLTVDAVGVEVEIDRSITGPLFLVDTTNVEIRDSIVDAAAADTIDSAEGVAIAGPGGAGPGGALTIIASTIVGRVNVRLFPLVSNSILFARSPDGATSPIRAAQRQEGCMRFSYVPQDAITPRRYRCQPQLAIEQAVAAREVESGVAPTALQRARIEARISRWLVPSFTALSASAPAYAQLRNSSPIEIRQGASDESEMGVYHQLFQPQRETNLRIRLEEYLRFGLEAGPFYET